MNLKQAYRVDGCGRPFVITIPAHANTSSEDLLRNAEDAVRPLRRPTQIALRPAVGYAGEPGASAPSIIFTGQIQAGQNHELYNNPGAAMQALVKIAEEVAQYLPAHLSVDGKKRPSIRIQYDDQDVYLDRDGAVTKAHQAVEA
ncbi:hypothetical protein HY971_03090 [Candidatus Kaiserbacteria bacterium]|nr:hypothetical protein [Candidatus Kaiserbacteria bacterium]